MTYTTYSNLFVNDQGVPIAEGVVPKSCIQSAEYIIRAIKLGHTRTRHAADVTAEFGNKVTINISKDEFLGKDKPAAKLTNYPFTVLPSVGQGIMLLNNTSSNLDYNMHLGAVVAAKAGEIVISHMFEVVSPHLDTVPLVTLTLTSVKDFADQTFGGQAHKYAVGLLTCA